MTEKFHNSSITSNHQRRNDFEKEKIVKTAALALCLMCIGGQVYAAPVEQETETVTSEVLAQESVAESEPGTVPGETAQKQKQQKRLKQKVKRRL